MNEPRWRVALGNLINGIPLSIAISADKILTQLKLLKLGFFVGDKGFRIKSQQTVQEINVANCTEGVLEECGCHSSLKMVVCRQERFLAG